MMRDFQANVFLPHPQLLLAGHVRRPIYPSPSREQINYILGEIPANTKLLLVLASLLSTAKPALNLRPVGVVHVDICHGGDREADFSVSLVLRREVVPFGHQGSRSAASSNILLGRGSRDVPASA